MGVLPRAVPEREQSARIVGSRCGLLPVDGGAQPTLRGSAPADAAARQPDGVVPAGGSTTVFCSAAHSVGNVSPSPPPLRPVAGTPTCCRATDSSLGPTTAGSTCSGPGGWRRCRNSPSSPIERRSLPSAGPISTPPSTMRTASACGAPSVASSWRTRESRSPTPAKDWARCSHRPPPSTTTSPTTRSSSCIDRWYGGTALWLGVQLLALARVAVHERAAVLEAAGRTGEPSAPHGGGQHWDLCRGRPPRKARGS